MTDKVNHPAHYNKGGMEVIEGLRMLTPEEYKGFMKANVIKYVARCEYKDNAVEDLEKAEFYLGKLKEAVKKENETNEKIKVIDEFGSNLKDFISNYQFETNKIFGNNSDADKATASGKKPKEKYTLIEALKAIEKLNFKQRKEFSRIVNSTPYSTYSYYQYFGLPDEVKALSDDADMTMTNAGFSYKPTSKPEMLTVYIPTMGFFGNTKTVEFTKESMKDLVIENYWLEQKNDDLKEKVKELESKRWWQR